MQWEKEGLESKVEHLYRETKSIIADAEKQGIKLFNTEKAIAELADKVNSLLGKIEGTGKKKK
jgi:hypothetical protein